MQQSGTETWAENKTHKNWVYISINTICAVYSFQTDHEILLTDSTLCSFLFVHLFASLSLIWCCYLSFWRRHNELHLTFLFFSLPPDRQPPCRNTETSEAWPTWWLGFHIHQFPNVPWRARWALHLWFLRVCDGSRVFPLWALTNSSCGEKVDLDDF